MDFPKWSLPFATQNSEGSRDPARAILRCTATATLREVSLADEAALTPSSVAMGVTCEEVCPGVLGTFAFTPALPSVALIRRT